MPALDTAQIYQLQAQNVNTLSRHRVQTPGFDTTFRHRVQTPAIDTVLDTVLSHRTQTQSPCPCSDTGFRHRRTPCLDTTHMLRVWTSDIVTILRLRVLTPHIIDVNTVFRQRVQSPAIDIRCRDRVQIYQPQSPAIDIGHWPYTSSLDYGFRHLAQTPCLNTVFSHWPQKPCQTPVYTPCLVTRFRSHAYQSSLHLDNTGSRQQIRRWRRAVGIQTPSVATAIVYWSQSLEYSHRPQPRLSQPQPSLVSIVVQHGVWQQRCRLMLGNYSTDVDQSTSTISVVFRRQRSHAGDGIVLLSPLRTPRQPVPAAVLASLASTDQVEDAQFGSQTLRSSCCTSGGAQSWF